MTPRSARSDTPGHTARDGGFSLIEVVIALAILMVVTSGVYRAINTSTRTVTGLQGLVNAQASARTVLAGLQGELRNAFSGTSNVAQVITMGPSTVEFTSVDRETPLHLRRITYGLTSGVLTRAMVTSTNTYSGQSTTWTWPSGTPADKSILTGVTNTTLFVYKDALGVVTTDPSLVRVVEVTLTVRDPKARTTQPAETYTTTIRMRGTG